MKIISLLCLIIALSSTACMHRDTHQGNVFSENDVWLIQEGDTKFHVETVLGTPAIKDLLHPNRVQYVEQVTTMMLCVLNTLSASGLKNKHGNISTWPTL